MASEEESDDTFSIEASGLLIERVSLGAFVLGGVEIWGDCIKWMRLSEDIIVDTGFRNVRHTSKVSRRTCAASMGFI